MRQSMTMMHRSRNEAAAPSLLEDQRGAVMLTGLFMAFCLIGALWYVIGIGEALIFRDRMQEAADSAAFTGAVMNAKGMNFISVCNIVMLLLVMVYLVFAVIQDATILTCLACFPCIPCCAACPYVWPAIQLNQRVARVVKIGLNVMTALEAAAAIGYPWLGTARGSEVGGTYKMRENQHSIANDKNTTASVWAIGMSNIPALGGGWAGPVPLGLPVEGKAYNELCVKIAKDAIGILTGFIFGGEGGGNALGSFLREALGSVAGALVKGRYCNDLSFAGAVFDGNVSAQRNRLRNVRDEVRDGTNQTRAQNSQVPEGGQTSLGFENQNAQAANNINTEAPFDNPTEGASWQGWSPWFDPGFDKGWGDKGYLVPHKSAGNGRQPHQIWAINRQPEYNDDNQQKVSFGAKTRRQDFDSSTQSVRPPGGFFSGYFAQAEFYYDCDNKWDQDDCNKDDNAAFGIRWRARLRRVQMFSLASVLQQFAFNNFAARISDAVRGVVDSAIGRFVPGGDMFRQTGLGMGVIDGLAGVINSQVIDPIMGAVQGQLDRLSEYLDPTGVGGGFH
jgi:hypothetical protein